MCICFIDVVLCHVCIVCAAQGAVQGPEEFAEGLVIGVRSLLGHTVGKKLKIY